MAKAEKKAAKKTNGEAAAPRGRKSAFEPTAKISVLNKENPHREGSTRAAAFAAVLKAKTVEAYFASGSKHKYLGDWVASKHIAIA